MFFLTQVISFGFGATTDNFSTLEKLEDRLLQNTCGGSINQKEILAQWEEYKDECKNKLAEKGYFMFHAHCQETQKVIGVIVGS